MSSLRNSILYGGGEVSTEDNLHAILNFSEIVNKLKNSSKPDKHLPQLDYLSISVPIICISIVIAVVLILNIFTNALLNNSQSGSGSHQVGNSRSRRKINRRQTHKTGPDICVIEPTSITQQNSVRDPPEENEILLSSRLPKP